MSTQSLTSVDDADLTPLVVDVDDALLATDLLHEAMLRFVASFPFRSLSLLRWIAAGRDTLKGNLADHVDPGIDTVPLRPAVLALIRDAQSAGRSVYLASASDRRYIAALAQRIGGTIRIFGPEGGANLNIDGTAERLLAAFGSNGFDYVGVRPSRDPVWAMARRTFVVVRDDHERPARATPVPNAGVIARPRSRIDSYVRALRTHQWAKNLLIFLPLIAGHRFDPGTMAATLLAFACFCIAASSAYVFNDLLDIPGDRDHPRKRERPFATGAIPIPQGIAFAAGLLVGSFALSLILPWQFAGILSLYIVATLVYSLVLKRLVLIDVVTLGGLYTLRVYGGLAAINMHQTQWLLMFSLFLFLSLAIVKRCSELVVKHAAGKAELVGRGYQVKDLAVLLPLGAAAGYGAVFVVALYLSSPEMAALYTHPDRLWLVCPILIYWISRVLILANRGNLHDDPLIFALTDRASWMSGICVAAVIAASM